MVIVGTAAPCAIIQIGCMHVSEVINVRRSCVIVTGYCVYLRCDISTEASSLCIAAKFTSIDAWNIH